ncbi:MAG: CPBP family intramembrane glutamic endopeptidase [Gemmatimonadaceae bacterium]
MQDRAIPAELLTAVPDRFARLRMRWLVLWPILGGIAVVVVALMPPRSSFGATVGAALSLVYAILLLAALMACRAAGLAPADVVGPAPRDARPWLTAALLGPLVLAFSAASLWATIYLAGMVAPGWAEAQLSEEQDPAGLLDRLGTGSRVLLGFIVVVFAPVVEEFVFRGMLMRKWMASRGLWTGLIGSALVFSLMHPPNWIGSFMFGLVAGILYLWSGSLLLAILVHVINNGVVALVLLAQRAFPPEAQPTPTTAEFQATWIAPSIMLVMIGALLASVAWPLLREVRVRFR